MVVVGDGWLSSSIVSVVCWKRKRKDPRWPRVVGACICVHRVAGNQLLAVDKAVWRFLNQSITSERRSLEVKPYTVQIKVIGCGVVQMMVSFFSIKGLYLGHCFPVVVPSLPATYRQHSHRLSVYICPISISYVLTLNAESLP